jgi:hypothetical protein
LTYDVLDVSSWLKLVAGFATRVLEHERDLAGHRVAQRGL